MLWLHRDVKFTRNLSISTTFQVQHDRTHTTGVIRLQRVHIYHVRWPPMTSLIWNFSHYDGCLTVNMCVNFEVITTNFSTHTFFKKMQFKQFPIKLPLLLPILFLLIFSVFSQAILFQSSKMLFPINSFIFIKTEFVVFWLRPIDELRYLINQPSSFLCSQTPNLLGFTDTFQHVWKVRSCFKGMHYRHFWWLLKSKC